MTIPSRVTYIGERAFDMCSSLTTINYCGTEAEWESISKGSDWNYRTGEYTMVYNYTEE